MYLALGLWSMVLSRLKVCYSMSHSKTLCDESSMELFLHFAIRSLMNISCDRWIVICGRIIKSKKKVSEWMGHWGIV